MENKAKKVLDFLTENAEDFVSETSVVDKRDYTVVEYTYEMYPEDLPDFIEEHLMNPGLEIKVTVRGETDDDKMVDLRFDSANECAHICIVTVEEDGLMEFLEGLDLVH